MFFRKNSGHSNIKRLQHMSEPKMTLNADQLNQTADEIMRIDGDRDHMVRSNLNCKQTQSIARFLRALAREYSKA